MCDLHVNLYILTTKQNINYFVLIYMYLCKEKIDVEKLAGAESFNNHLSRAFSDFSSWTGHLQCIQ